VFSTGAADRTLSLEREVVDPALAKHPVAPPASDGPIPPAARLVLLSALMLFVELALIRWLGSEVVYLSYFSNFVLLGSFLGIGIGFLQARRHRSWLGYFPIVLALLAAFVLIFPAGVERAAGGLILVGASPTGVPAFAMLPVIFVAVAAIMATVASGVAATFAGFPALTAYRLDIAGSLAGIVAFSILSFLEAPPAAWGGVVAAMVVVLTLPRPSRVTIIGGVALVVILAAESLTPGISWSPYYKIQVATSPTAPGTYFLSVNGVPHQTIESYASMVANHSANLLPYTHLVHAARSVLIIGAGNGKDVEAALRNGANDVDAVEIDPRIAELGRELNPDHPYADPRVHLHVTDGRAFLEQTDKHYDLIVFAATDSITLVLGQSSLRLESYLFTKDAMQTAFRHLNPGGSLAAFNYYWQPWYLDRLAGTLQSVFSKAPCVDAVRQQGTVAALTVSAGADSLSCTTPWRPTSTPVPAPVSDDFPFPYLQAPGIPAVILISLLAILLAAALLVRLAGGQVARLHPYTDLFAMGAAFLLLETKSLVQFALLFGTTWLVNALVFAGVLITILAAIEVAKRVRVRRAWTIYVPLVVALTIAWFIPLDALLALPFWPRLLAAVAYAFTPIFLANLVFAERFRDTADSTSAFAANLLGTIVGGVLEYLSLVLGYRNLLILVGLLYAAAFIAGRGALRRLSTART
jgi:spermidine synthase